MHKLQTELNKVVHSLFKDNKIDLVIGYESGSLPLTTRPCIIKNENEVDKLIWNSFCSNNLAVYVPGIRGNQGKKAKPSNKKVAIVAKGCDARSITSLIVENQISDEDIHIIGIPCTGMADPKKIREQCGGSQVVLCSEDGNGVLKITTKDNKTIEINKEDVLAEACLECARPVPENTDILLDGTARPASTMRHTRIGEFESKPVEERWSYFREEMSKCIRCYACRNACPNCYCKNCFAEQTKPEWIGMGNEQTDVMLYHIGRIFHQAGRCVGCDACVRACPMGIDLRLFTGKLVKDVEDLYDFTPGISRDTDPPLCAFNQADGEDFITEPSLNK